jgi:transcriptional regulator with XRE-family HTH domain
MRGRPRQGIYRISEEEWHLDHLHRTAITHIERATRSSTLKTIEKLAKALGVQPSDLLVKFELIV